MEHALSVVSKLLSNLDTLRPTRDTHDTVFQIISELVLINRGDFDRTTSPGERRDRNIFDSTAAQAAQTLAAILHSGLTDPSTRWFNLRPKDRSLTDQDDVKLWIEQVQDIMFNVFTQSEGGFTQQNHEFLLDIVSFGTAVMWVSEEPDDGLIFQSRHLAEIYIEENNKGFVDTIYREFQFTARQAEQEWGNDALGTKLQTALMKDPHQKFKFVHAVLPKKDFHRLGGDISKIERFEFASVYISRDDKHVVKIGGFHEMPYLVARWEKIVGEIYGRSPAWTSLSDIEMIQIMSEAKIKKAQKELDPPLLLSDEGVMLPLQTFPGGVMIGALSDEGQPLVQTLPLGGRVEIALDEMEQRRDAIRKAFFIDQFLENPALRGKQPRTATEASITQENNLRLMGPQIRRIEDEYLSPLVNRVFGMLFRKGLFPDLPASVINQGLSILDLDIEYVSPLAFSQRTNQLLSYNRFFSNVGPFIEFNPEAMDNFDIDKIIRDAAEISGIPINQIRASAEVEVERQQRAQAQAEQQQLEQLMEGADVAANLQKSGIDIAGEGT